MRPIIRDAASLFAALRRVEVQPIKRLLDGPLAERIAAEAAVLCIVNTRAHAVQLFAKLLEPRDEQGCFHLSTWMCGAHRRSVLAEIRERLKCGKPCRAVSTLLVEAGVDLDFPVVYRAAAGFDSIAQAAGRCIRILAPVIGVRRKRAKKQRRTSVLRIRPFGWVP